MRAPLVFPIRFAAGSMVVQTTTRELSRDGVYVRCLKPPPEGAEVELKLYLPGTRAGLEAVATVREVAPSGKEQGFWAEFTHMAEEDRSAIAAVLERRARAAKATPIGAMALQPYPPKPPAIKPEEDPRRAFPRYQARFAVRFATVQDFVLEYAANISAGGIFVCSEDPPEMDAVVKVEMELPGGGPPVQASGVVVHRVTKEQAQQRGTMAGIGVQFVDSDDEFRVRMDAAIEYILKERDPN
jgi:uncharacterized protein (TIGR02266 family)